MDNDGVNLPLPNGNEGGIIRAPCGGPRCQRDMELLTATIDELRRQITVLQAEPGRRRKRGHKAVRWDEQQCFYVRATADTRCFTDMA